MAVFYQPQTAKGLLYLDEEESRHCVKVLRKKEGDEIKIIDGLGGFYTAKIKSSNPKKCEFSIIKSVQEPKKDFYVHIAIAPTKNADRIEWFIEKSIEIGVDEISFLLCQNSERKNLNIERLNKKAVSAVKQSLRATMPTINNITSLDRFLSKVQQSNRYIAYVDNENPLFLGNIVTNKTDYCVLIGPEGDFSNDELSRALDHQFIKVSLGPNRLRTETAGLVACHSLNIIQYIN